MFKFFLSESFSLLIHFGVKQSYKTCFPEFTDEDSKQKGINVLAKEHVNGYFGILASILIVWLNYFISTLLLLMGRILLTF